MISIGSTVYHSATMAPPGPPLHSLHLGDIPVPLKTPTVGKHHPSGDPSGIYQELLLSLSFQVPLWIVSGLDYYMRQPRPMVRILREAISLAKISGR
jgi:hypothetical protein